MVDTRTVLYGWIGLLSGLKLSTLCRLQEEARASNWMTHNRHDLDRFYSNPELAIRCKVPLWWARDGRHHFSSYRMARIDMRSNSQQTF